MISIRKYVPNIITSMNLLCGLVGVVFAFKGRPEIAFPLMLAASVFDFCDGLAARVLHAYSPMGKELDSLSDLVSFGVLPSVMLYNMMKACSFSETVWCYIPLLIGLFSGLRLAKFNVDERQTKSFIGLPTPAAAILVGSLCYFVAFEPDSFLCAWIAGPVFGPVLTLVVCALLVSELPMFSMKFSKDDTVTLRNKRLAFAVNCAICVLIVLLVGLNWSLALMLAFTVYILMNVAFAIFKV